MTDLDTRCMVANIRRQPQKARDMRHQDLRAYVEAQRLASIARLEADEDALHLQPLTFWDHAKFAAGTVCGLAFVCGFLFTMGCL